MRANRELTIETALADPMIRAAMRADHVAPGAFETLLRTTARQLEADGARPLARPARHLPAGVLEGHACA